MLEIIIDVVSYVIGGFLAVLFCSKYDSWQRYRRKVGKDAFETVYKKVLNIEQRYFYDGNMEASNDCIRLQNLMNYFKEEICDENN